MAEIQNGVEVYNSSEEFQRAHAAGLAQKKAEEAQRIRKTLDKYIAKYSKTTETRKRALSNGKTADHQLDVDADVVEILEKIKNELR